MPVIGKQAGSGLGSKKLYLRGAYINFRGVSCVSINIATYLSMAVPIQSILFLLVMVLFVQALLVHSKSLKAVMDSSTVVSNQPKSNSSVTKRTVGGSSCSPSTSQMQYFNRLYSQSGLISSSNGNTMHYSLRALQAERIRTSKTEDNKLIASIKDQSRFIPAGMDTANKVVCAKILRELDGVANSISKTALCGWDYVCNYKKDRFPNYLFKSRCKTARCNINCNQGSSKHTICQSHGIYVTVLFNKGSCTEWVWGQELLPIACTCTSGS